MKIRPPGRLNPEDCEPRLQNYRRLVENVDALCARLEKHWQSSLACRKGCDGCCRHLSLFWVEGVALARAAADLPPGVRDALRERARRCAPADPCPLLEERSCLLYEARPLICRTHGLPLLVGEEGEKRLDFCPENFSGIVSFPAGATLDLDRLNVALATVNTLFTRQVFGSDQKAGERLSIAEFLLLPLESD